MRTWTAFTWLRLTVQLSARRIPQNSSSTTPSGVNHSNQETPSSSPSSMRRQLTSGTDIAVIIGNIAVMADVLVAAGL